MNIPRVSSINIDQPKSVNEPKKQAAAQILLGWEKNPYYVLRVHKKLVNRRRFYGLPDGLV